MDERSLQQEYAALTEQVKLLVKTEQRLFRSQCALDRQLAGVRHLSEFALRWDGRACEAEILADAVALVRHIFNVERVTGVTTDKSSTNELSHARGMLHTTSAEMISQALDGLDGPHVLTTSALSPALAALLRESRVVRDTDTPRRATVILPLRSGGPRTAAFVAASCADPDRTSPTRETPNAAAAPLLLLVASHIEHALRNTRLLEDLAATQRDVIRARDHLEEQVELRTRELTREVAERRRAEAQLLLAKDAAEEASRAKSAFVANMSHELRTPLNAIIGYSELIREESEALPPDVVQDIDRIVSASRHLLRLINDVLDLSKIGAGRMTLESEPFGVAALIGDVVATTAPAAIANGNRVEMHVDADLGDMVGDRTRVMQVLLNVLGNAAKFTSHGVIRIVASRHIEDGSAVLRFRIEDTGIGMTEEELGRVFGEFTQADSSTTRRYGGSGLGLAIARTLCRLMGGDIQAESQPRVGTVFTVTLPVTSATVRAA